MGLLRETVNVGSVLTLGILSVACGSETSKDAAGVSIVINELQSRNTVVVNPDDPEQKKPDWIELYNLDSKPVDLAGYFFTDDETTLDKFTFTTDAVIAPGKFLVLWAADDTTKGPLYLGFKLSGSGDNAILTNPDGYIVDRVAIPAATGQDISYARFPDGTGEFSWCATETHGALNGKSCPKP